MIAALAHALARRTRRERLLLGLLMGLALPVGFVFLVVLPLMVQGDTARAALADAEAERQWYVARQVEIAALPVAGAGIGVSVTPPIGLGGIEERLIGAGLRDAVSLLTTVQGDAVSLTLADVSFNALMDWIDAVERDAGYRLAALRLERGTPGLVSADLRLEPGS